MPKVEAEKGRAGWIRNKKDPAESFTASEGDALGRRGRIALILSLDWSEDCADIIERERG